MNKSIAKVTNQLSYLLIVSTIVVILAVFITHRITVASLETTKKELADTQLEKALESYRLGLIGNVAMITNLKMFIDFTRSGPITRKKLKTEMLQSLGQLKKSEVIGIDLFLKKDNDKIISIGEPSSSNLSLELCYFGDILSSEFGECNARLVLYLDSLAITQKIVHSSTDVKQCFDCESIDLFKDFKSKVFKLNSGAKVPVYAKAIPQNYNNIFILFEISIVILILFYVYWVRSRITAIVKNEVVDPIQNLTKKISAGHAGEKDDSISELLAIEANYLRGEAILQTTQMLAHDVRKPFSMVKGLLTLLVDEKNHEKTRKLVKEYVPEIDKAIFSVDQMISDVMNMGAKINLIEEDVSIEELLYSSAKEVFRIYRRDDVNVEFEIDACRLLSVDKAKIKRVLSNILANALQAMAQGAKVSFRAYQLNDKQLELEITNTGSFISEDKLANIFDSFYTFGKKSGTGLGLAISKKFVEAHGGKISCLSSEKMGQVSFYMSLPLAESSHSEAISEQYTGADFVIRKKQEELGEKSKDRQLETLCNEVKMKALKLEKKRILIADDEELYLEAVKGIFSSYGLEQYFHIDFETSAKRAVEDLRYSDIDILICDIDFEGEDIDGIDLAKHLANINKNIKMAIHSNRSMQSVRKELEGIECDFITKPISRKALLSFILSAMQVKPRVLVIEDSPLMAAMWRSKLGQCHVDCIASADEVDVVLTQTNVCYDLIILDRYLDTSDSLECLYPQKLKAIFNCPIILSSNAKLSSEESSDIDLEVGKEAISFIEIQNRLKENAHV